MAKSLFPFTEPEVDKRVTAFSLNKVEVLTHSQPVKTQQGNTAERLVMLLLQGIRTIPDTYLSGFPMSEIEAVLGSSEESLSPLLVKDVYDVLKLPLPLVQLPSGVENRRQVVATPALSESRTSQDSVSERFQRCDKCSNPRHTNYFYNSDSCACHCCLICIRDHKFTHCPKCSRPYSETQLGNIEAMYRYWSGDFQQT